MWHHDALTRPPDHPIRHHRRRRLLRGHGYFKRLGPGIVTGAADDDPSGIGTYSQVGAAFGFTMLWTALVSLPLATAVQETSARLGLVTGRGLSELIRRHFPKPVLYLAVAVVAAANTFNIAADLGAMAASLRLLVPVPHLVGLAIFTAVITLLELTVAYHRYARILRWLALSLLSYVGVVVVVDVDWAQVARSVLHPGLTWDRATVAALIAVFGTTISPYLFFWQAGEEVEEEHDQEARGGSLEGRTSEHLQAMRVDVAGGMFSGVAVMFCIMTSAAVTLAPAGVRTVSTAAEAAEALRPVAGPFAEALFALGIVGTGLLAVPVLAGSTAYALAEAVNWHEGLSGKLRAEPGFYGTIALSMLVGLGINLAGLDPIVGLYLAAVGNGLAAPLLILLMIILGRRRSLMGDQRSGTLSLVGCAAALVLMTALPLVYLVS